MKFSSTLSSTCPSDSTMSAKTKLSVPVNARVSLFFTTLNKEIRRTFVSLHGYFFGKIFKALKGLTVDTVEEVLDDMKIPPRSHSEIVRDTRARNLAIERLSMTFTENGKR